MDKILEALQTVGVGFTDASSPAYSGVYMVRNPTQSYTARYRGQWFKPEYDFNDIRTAQDTDSFIAKSIEKKSVKFLLAGYEFSGENPKTVDYIKKRIKQFEVTSGKPFNIILLQTAQDLFSLNNAAWLCVRDDNNSGGKVYKRFGKTVKPISAIFVLPFETLEFKTKDSGELEKVRQVVPGATKTPEWKADDIIHFYMNRRPGNITGSPTMFAALEDVLILRRIEENVEELIESNLFPLFHYKIGTENAPERVNPKTGMREVEEVADTLKFMPSSGVYISDWRHEIEAVGSEGRALRIDYYLDYFKKRVFSALGVSPVDMGESDSSNRSTAQTQSKSLTEAVESMQALMKAFLDQYLIIPLLMESDFAFDVLAPENIVEINFNKIDISEQMQVENNANQLYQANALTHEELRQKIGKRPLKGEHEGSLNYNKFPNRAELAKAAALKAGGSGSTQAANQYGTSPKKTAAKKDYEVSNLLTDDLMDRWKIFQAFITTNKDDHKDLIDNWTIETSERIYALIKNRIRMGAIASSKLEIIDRMDVMTNSGYDFHQELRIVSLTLARSLVKNLNAKIDFLHNTGISLNTIFDSLDWRVVTLQTKIAGLYEIAKSGQEINLNIFSDIG